MEEGREGDARALRGQEGQAHPLQLLGFEKEDHQRAQTNTQLLPFPTPRGNPRALQGPHLGVKGALRHDQHLPHRNRQFRQVQQGSQAGLITLGRHQILRLINLPADRPHDQEQTRQHLVLQREEDRSTELHQRPQEQGG